MVLPFKVSQSVVTYALTAFVLGRVVPSIYGVHGTLIELLQLIPSIGDPPLFTLS